MRDPETYAKSHIPNAINIPKANITEWIQQKKPDLINYLDYFETQKPWIILFHCGSSLNRGPAAAKELETLLMNLKISKNIHTDQVQVGILKGGFKKWEIEYGNDPCLIIRDLNQDDQV